MTGRTHRVAETILANSSRRNLSESVSANWAFAPRLAALRNRYTHDSVVAVTWQRDHGLVAGRTTVAGVDGLRIPGGAVERTARCSCSANQRRATLLCDR